MLSIKNKPIWASYECPRRRRWLGETGIIAVIYLFGFGIPIAMILMLLGII